MFLNYILFFKSNTLKNIKFKKKIFILISDPKKLI